MMTPQVKIAGDTWTFKVQWLDANGHPVALPSNVTPFAELYVGTSDGTYGQGDGVVLDIVNVTLGLGIVTVPLGISGGILPLGLSDWTEAGYPVRLAGGLVDGLAARTTYFVEPVVVVDWRTMDLSQLPPSSVIMALSGPSDPTTIKQFLDSLPTTLPATSGVYWLNGGTVARS